MHGDHMVRSWSKTKAGIVLSSAEAELSACIKTSAEAIGILQMAESLGRTMEATVYVDSSAALVVVGRKGNWRLRHIRDRGTRSERGRAP